MAMNKRKITGGGPKFLNFALSIRFVYNQNLK